MDEKKVKEPIRKPWIWVVLVIIILAGIPWYLPQGTIYPIIFGFPYWAFISVIMSLVLADFLSYVVTHEWNMVEEEERKREV